MTGRPPLTEFQKMYKPYWCPLCLHMHPGQFRHKEKITQDIVLEMNNLSLSES